MRAMIFVMFLLVAVPSMAQEGGRAPPTGNACVETDYDCQPGSLSEAEYDRMALSVPLNRDLPALVELEPLDSEATTIRRFMLNARGIMGREVPIEASKGLFCTLSHATNLTLTYFPASGLWTFVIDFNAQAELMAGGLATCFDPVAAGKNS